MVVMVIRECTSVFRLKIILKDYLKVQLLLDIQKYYI